MTKRLWSILAGAIALAGCGSNSSTTPSGFCDRVISLAPSLTAKFAPCASSGFSFDAPSSSQECQASLANCTENDRNILNGVLDCMSALPTCSTATLSDFATKAQACDPSTKGLSAACNAAI